MYIPIIMMLNIGRLYNRCGSGCSIWGLNLEGYVCEVHPAGRARSQIVKIFYWGKVMD